MAVINTKIFSLLTLLLSINLLHSSSTPVTMTSDICINELVSFSPCLPYTASPPSNFSSSASYECCYGYNDILISGRGFCLCFLLLQPPVFGAPLDSAKILSLSSICPPRHSNFGSLTNFSLHSLCSDSEVAPPPQAAGPESGINTTTEQFSDPPTQLSPSPEMDLTQTSADSLLSLPPGLHFNSSQASSARISSSTPFSIILSSLCIMLSTLLGGASVIL